jgi:hypothetical protein
MLVAAARWMTDQTARDAKCARSAADDAGRVGDERSPSTTIPRGRRAR